MGRHGVEDRKVKQMMVDLANRLEKAGESIDSKRGRSAG